jgi:ABC-type phosphate transport system auxiliary subunit
LTLSQRKEQLEGTLTRKEELWEATKSELQQERQQLNERLDEMRRK